MPDCDPGGWISAWKQLGRWVRKGARGIAIIAPIVRGPRSVAVEPLDTDDADARVAGYRAAYVFEQTAGVDLPNLESRSSGDPGAHFAALEQAIRAAGVILVDANDLGGAEGASLPGRIEMLASLKTADRFCTLAHEFATSCSTSAVTALRRRPCVKQKRAGVHVMTTISIQIIETNGHAAPGKLADAEIHFIGGELDGLKLVGFAVWQRRDGRGENVSFPARQFTVHGDRRSFSLLRWIAKREAQERLEASVLEAYRQRHSNSSGNNRGDVA